MYPAPFDYVAPTSLEEAVEELAQRGDDARVLAGGQSLIPMMKLRLAVPAALVDINRVPGLDSIQEANGHLAIGALVRNNDIVDSDIVERTNHTVAAAAPWISDPIVRNRGTLCGSVAHCDPEGDWNSVMLAVGAEVVARSATGERVIPIADFIADFFTNTLQPGEMVTEVRIPKYTGRAGGTYIKLERKVGDYATAAVATHLQLEDDGRIAQAGIAMTSVAPINRKATEAEQMLVGQTPSAELFGEAAQAAANAADPETNVRGPAEYKRDLIRVYTRRGLAKALEIAQGS
ncbi:MAG: xanthine dehydrogenase family protein subunit M [Nitriliruptorales bacterium]|nr:xanthine dehydrogenase family protein subunit M [Nitriliruptorales bacterium]